MHHFQGIKLPEGDIMYCAIIGDIIDSREIIKDRSETQERFKNALRIINGKYKNSIKSDFTITAGDGFYGLLSSVENLFDIILDIRLAIVPNQIRMGIGIGTIGTKIVRNESNLVDGRANSTAREAIDYLSDKKSKYESVYMTTFLKVDSKQYDRIKEFNTEKAETCKTYEEFINTLLCACSDIEKNGTLYMPKQ